VLQAVTFLAQSLRCSQEAVLWCKERAARAGDRAAALVPALQELERAVLVPGQGVEARLVESISIMLVLLAKVWPLLPVGGVAVVHRGCCCCHSVLNCELHTMHLHNPSQYNASRQRWHGAARTGLSTCKCNVRSTCLT
jgi:hypothetical protein